MFWRGSVRGVPESHAEYGIHHPHQEHTPLHWQLQGTHCTLQLKSSSIHVHVCVLVHVRVCELGALGCVGRVG